MAGRGSAIDRGSEVGSSALENRASAPPALEPSSDMLFGASMLQAEVSQHTEPASAAGLSVDGSGCCESTSNMFSSRGQDGRAQQDVAATEGSVAMGETESDASASPVPALPAAGGGSDEPFACLTPAELQERARLMFVIGDS